MCFVWIWEQTAIISLYSIDWLVFVTETECVYCAVRAECLYATQNNFILPSVNVALLWWPKWKHFTAVLTKPIHSFLSLARWMKPKTLCLFPSDSSNLHPPIYGQLLYPCRTVSASLIPHCRHYFFRKADCWLKISKPKQFSAAEHNTRCRYADHVLYNTSRLNSCNAKWRRIRQPWCYPSAVNRLTLTIRRNTFLCDLRGFETWFRILEDKYEFGHCENVLLKLSICTWDGGSGGIEWRLEEIVCWGATWGEDRRGT